MRELMMNEWMNECGERGWGGLANFHGWLVGYFLQRERKIDAQQQEGSRYLLFNARQTVVSTWNRSRTPFFSPPSPPARLSWGRLRVLVASFRKKITNYEEGSFYYHRCTDDDVSVCLPAHHTAAAPDRPTRYMISRYKHDNKFHV